VPRRSTAAESRDLPLKPEQIRGGGRLPGLRGSDDALEQTGVPKSSYQLSLEEDRYVQRERPIALVLDLGVRDREQLDGDDPVALQIEAGPDGDPPDVLVLLGRHEPPGAGGRLGPDLLLHVASGQDQQDDDEERAAVCHSTQPPCRV
jgi:hypothetical protein